MPPESNRFRPAWWLTNPHAQTIWGKVARRRVRLRARTECLIAPDGDDIELLHTDALPGAPRVLMLHGLEGSPRSHYVGGIVSQAESRGWGATLMVFRGCGSTANRARRFYHSGETSDLDFVFRTLVERYGGSWFVTGVSLGGNVVLKWLGERGRELSEHVRAAAAVSVPFDLEAGARHISRGFSRVYDRSFVRSLRRKAIAKLALYPDLFDRPRLEQARTIYDFDDAVTAPVHGFSDARDYYEKSSSLRFLGGIRLPTLLLSARDDPFLPSEVLLRVAAMAALHPALSVEFHDHGGHVGFVTGRWPWRPDYYAERRVFRFFEEHLKADGDRG